MFYMDLENDVTVLLLSLAELLEGGLDLGVDGYSRRRLKHSTHCTHMQYSWGGLELFANNAVNF